MKRRSVVAFGLASSLSPLLPAFADAAASAIPTTPEPGPVRIALEPWLGYGLWEVAQKKGFFAKNGLHDVKLLMFTEDKDLDTAFAGGRADVGCVATNTAMSMTTAGIDLKAVLLMDYSNTADAILAPKSITSIKQLKGQSIAYEEGSTSDVLLHYALHSVGMSIKDIKKVPMPADAAGTAMLAGRVKVAVTYEPYISSVLAQHKGYHRLFTAGVDPGLISDVVIVNKEMREKKPGQIVALLKSWQDAYEYYQTNTEDAQAIIAKAVGSNLKDLKSAFAGVKYYSVPESAKAFKGVFGHKVFEDVLHSCQQAGLVQGTVTPGQMLDGRFLEAAIG